MELVIFLQTYEKKFLIFSNIKKKQVTLHQ